ncbi:ArsA-related P-loop ATPase [Streptomyces sp. DSM 42041]|uniref:ArsA-related P-loop ATPase n=1 Tax=Streptomyces hazeniae TaxID=3075538 RepID=A0ABU2NVL2_9ACTN|nr:ArsA-related P-loop ATPase [Streptomyces sp. DSM 42041]MDT0381024.1 ArsA-related P-loop ATPase [Streptomyces sp. DSM 42041]
MSADGLSGRPRLLLVTGTGGAGRTTVAAATALAAARGGARTLLLSTEEDGVLERVLGARTAAGEPAEADPGTGLWAARVDPDAEVRALAALLRERGDTLLRFTGAEALDDDELTPLPGAEEFAVLRAVRRAAAQEGTGAGGRARWDAVVVDLPPVERALRTLALPDQVRRYLDRLLPPQKQAARALRPLLAGLAGVPMPPPGLYAGADRFRAELADVAGVLTAPGTAVRLVAEPGDTAVERLHTARAALALYGLRCDTVIANRVLPTRSRDPFLAALSGEQQAALKALRAHPVRGLPVREVPHLGRAPMGTADLAELADLLGSVDPAASPDPARSPDVAEPPRGVFVPGQSGAPGTVEDRRATEGRLHWRLPLPGARKEALGLVRRGDELVVGVGPHRRTLPLPSALRRCRVTGAAFENGELCVRFEPDPSLWPERPDDPTERGADGTAEHSAQG